MALTSNGLADIGMGPGRTTNFFVQYENSQPNAIKRAQALLTVVESEFTSLSGRFNIPSSAFGTGNRITVNVNQPFNSGANNQGYSTGGGSHMNLDHQNNNPSDTNAAEIVKMLFVAEFVEIFMSYNDQKVASTYWTAGNSDGEALSQYWSIAEFKTGHYLYYGSWAPQWMNSPSTRPDWITNPEGTDKDPISFGCALLFIYYLNAQLGFSINQIISSYVSNLATTYQNLTGKADGWTSFINLVNKHYPSGPTYNPIADNIFPVSELSAFFNPNQVTCGYSNSTLIFIDSPATAEVNISLTSDDPEITVSNVTIPVGTMSTEVLVQSKAISLPFAPKVIAVHATYAGKTLTISVDVVPPTVASITLSPNSVVCGNKSIATVNLNLPSLIGPVVVNLFCSAPGFATLPNPPQISIPQNKISATFIITTRNILIPFPTAHAGIYASYAGTTVSAVLTINPSVVAGILQSLTLFPSIVIGGNTSVGTLTLVEAVPIDTVVSLAAIDSGVHFPVLGGGSSLVSVPPSVTILAGRANTTFRITTTHLHPPPLGRSVTLIAGAVIVKYARLMVTSS